MTGQKEQGGSYWAGLRRAVRDVSNNEGCPTACQPEGCRRAARRARSDHDGHDGHMEGTESQDNSDQPGAAELPG